jgi:hypothetical protein
MQRLSAAVISILAIFVLVMAAVSCGSGNHLVSVSVSPNPIEMSAPQTVQLQAIGTYSDGTTKVLTGVNWTLSEAQPAVTLSNGGLVNCQMPGSLPNAGTVIASFEGISGSAPVGCAGVVA